MRKLAAYPRQNQIARALNEIGQLEKTVFILELLLDPQLRHRQERGLNDGEAVNSASRAIFVGQRGEFHDRVYQDQVHRASCLHLLVAAIGAWTTPYLADAIAALRAEGEDVPDELIAHLSTDCVGAGQLPRSVHLRSGQCSATGRSPSVTKRRG